jgi:hypothetical protein
VPGPFLAGGCRARAVRSPSSPRRIWVFGHRMVVEGSTVRLVGLVDKIFAGWLVWRGRVTIWFNITRQGDPGPVENVRCNWNEDDG